MILLQRPQEENNSVLTVLEFKNLLLKVRSEISYTDLQPYNRAILAENIKDSNLTKTYPSINSLAKEIKGDRSTIRKHLNNPLFSAENKYYRKE